MDNPDPTHHTTMASNALDKLAALVGQDRALQAVHIADDIKGHIADAIKAAGEKIAEVVDPKVFAELEQLKQTIINRDATVATLELEVTDLQTKLLHANSPEPSPLVEVKEGDPVDPNDIF